MMQRMTWVSGLVGLLLAMGTGQAGAALRGLLPLGGSNANAEAPAAPAPAPALGGLAQLGDLLAPDEAAQPTLQEQLDALVRGLLQPGGNRVGTLPAPQGTLQPQQINVGPDATPRHFLLYQPPAAAFDGSRDTYPLVLVLHGLNQSARQMSSSNSGRVWQLVADGAFQELVDGGFYVAFLSGTGVGGTSLGPASTAAWNDCDATRFNNPSNADDVSYARAVVEHLDPTLPLTLSSLDLPIDRSRVYAYGFSNGAGMALRLGREAGDLVAAVSAVSGVDPGPANDECREFEVDGISQRPPAAIMHGTADLLTPYANSACGANTPGQNCRLGHVDTVTAWKVGSGGNFMLTPPRIPFAKSAKSARPASAPVDRTQIECFHHVRKIRLRNNGQPFFDASGNVTPAAPDEVRVEDCIITGGGHVEPSILTYAGRAAELSFGRQNNDAESVFLAAQFFARHRR